MHPNRRFAWEDGDAIRAFVAEHAFAHLLVAGPGGVAVAHVPLVVTGDDAIEFHLARGNRINGLIADATVIASIAAPDFYVSPDWYVSTDQVPTWNYVAVEAEGSVVVLGEAALVAHLDALSLTQERRLAPKPVWTRAKMTPGRFEAMLPAIIGYRLRVTAWRCTRKLGQTKAEADIAGVAAGLRGIGRADAAALVEQANGARP